MLWLKILNAKYIISYNKNLKYGLERKDLELFDFYFNGRSDLVKKFGIEVESKYKIYLGKYEQVGNNFFDEKKINVIFNYIGSSSNRVLQETEVSEILKNLSEFNVNIYVSSTPEKYDYSRDLVNKLNKPNLMMLPYTKNIFEIASFIKESTIVVSVDTSIVHIASAYNKKILGFYLNDKDIFKAAQPKSDIYEIVFSEEKDKIINLDLSIIKKKFEKLV